METKVYKVIWMFNKVKKGCNIDELSKLINEISLDDLNLQLSNLIQQNIIKNVNGVYTPVETKNN